ARQGKGRRRLGWLSIGPVSWDAHSFETSIVPFVAAWAPPLRARDNCIGVGALSRHPDGGVLALTFVTALLARPRKVGVPCQDHLRECSRRAVYRRASKHQIVGKSWHFLGGVGAERPRRPRAGAWHRPKSPASKAWTFSLAISGECELDCSGTIDARFCAWRTPGGGEKCELM